MSQESCGLGDHETPRVGSAAGQTGPPETRRARRTYSVEEVAAMLGLSRDAAYRACRDKKIPGLIVIGRRYLISKVAFDAAVPADVA